MRMVGCAEGLARVDTVVLLGLEVAAALLLFGAQVIAEYGRLSATLACQAPGLPEKKPGLST